MNNWQPIETAPKEWKGDGYDFPILLAIAPIGALKDPAMRRVYEGRWNELQNDWTSVNGAIWLRGATHWMPLPEPPNES